MLSRDLTTNGQGRARFDFVPEGVGTYEAEARVGGSPEPAAASAFVTVESPGGELKDLRPDAELLRWLAEESGGRFYNIATDPAPRELPIRSEPVERLISRSAVSQSQS